MVVQGVLRYFDELQTYAGLRSVNFDDNYDADPRTRNWFLLNGSPVYVWALTATYLTFIYVGKRVMSTRQPFDLRGFMFFYNMALVGLSMYMFVEIILSAVDAGYGFICAPYNKETIKDPKELRIAKVLWWYFFSKAIEMCDTVLMVLRKRNRQVTFLHVFHHSAMLNIWWFVESFIPGGLSVFGSSLNCLVHVLMYSYYGLSVIPSLKNKIWWKHYITQFQLLQFCLTLAHTANSIYIGCDFPRWGQYVLTSFMVLMLVLFTNFYVHSYILRSRQKASGITDKKRDDENEDETNSSVGSNNGKAHLNGANGKDHIKRNGSSPRSKKVK